MSAYAASINQPKHKYRRSKNGGAAKTKLTIPQPSEASISGLSLRRRLYRSVIFGLETYLSFIIGFIIIIYIYGCRLVGSRSFSSSTKFRNPYSASETILRLQCDPSQDPSSNTDTVDGVAKLKPPRCLENPMLGVHKFIKIQVIQIYSYFYYS